MTILHNIDLFKCSPVNTLWVDFINDFGLNKAKLAIRQALDLQRMQGDSETLPILITGTCGVGLISHNMIFEILGFAPSDSNLILLYDSKEFKIQLLKSTF